MVGLRVTRKRSPTVELPGLTVGPRVTYKQSPTWRHFDVVNKRMKVNGRNIVRDFSSNAI